MNASESKKIRSLSLAVSWRFPSVMYKRGPGRMRIKQRTELYLEKHWIENANTNNECLINKSVDKKTA